MFWFFSILADCFHLVTLVTGWQVMGLLCGQDWIEIVLPKLACGVWLLWEKHQDLVLYLTALQIFASVHPTNLQHFLICTLLPN
jgi:hypothetical protein